MVSSIVPMSCSLLKDIMNVFSEEDLYLETQICQKYSFTVNGI